MAKLHDFYKDTIVAELQKKFEYKILLQSQVKSRSRQLHANQLRASKFVKAILLAQK